MNERDQEHEEIERLLKAARPAGPSGALKARVTGAARAAWDQRRAEVPWQIPAWRLAISAAAAAIIISFGNRLGDFAWPGGAVVARIPDPELVELAEMVYGPARSRLGTSRRGPSEGKGVTLGGRMEAVRQILDEMENNGVQGQPARGGGRSRLLPGRRHGGPYS